MDQKLKETYEKYAKLGKTNKVAQFLAGNLIRAVRASFIDLHVVGNIPKETSIFVHYHISSIDAPLIAQFLAYKENYIHGLMNNRAFERNPILNSLFGEIPFDSSIKSKEDFRWSLEEVKFWLGKNSSILMSNDGATERHRGRSLEEKIVSDLHARIAKKEGVQIVPVSPYVFKPEDIYIWQGKTTWKELARRWRLDYFLGFGEPVKPSDYANHRELAEEVKKRQILMYEKLSEMEKEHREGTYSLVKHLGASLKKGFKIDSPKI